VAGKGSRSHLPDPLGPGVSNLQRLPAFSQWHPSGLTRGRCSHSRSLNRTNSQPTKSARLSARLPMTEPGNQIIPGTVPKNKQSGEQTVDRQPSRHNGLPQ